MVFERIKQAFEGSQPWVQCGIPTEPGEELCPGRADPAIKVEMVVRLVSIRREAQARIDAGESLEAVAHGLLNDPSFEQLDPDASEDERVEQVRTQVAVQKVCRKTDALQTEIQSYRLKSRHTAVADVGVGRHSQ